MPSYTLSHLLDHDVQKGLLAAVPVERTATAAVLAHIAEFDARQLYRDQACSSMFVYCTRELGYSEDGASKRLHAARAARQFPVLFEAVADGRLHLSGVCLLAPKLTAENVDELVAEAAGRSKAEIEYLLAVRYPKPGTWAAVLTKSASSQEKEHAPGHVEGDPGSEAGAESDSAALEGDLGALLAATSPGAVATPIHRDRLTPIAADAWALEATLDQECCDMLRRIQALRGRGVSPHDIASVIKRAFALLEDDLLMRKLGAGTGKSRGSKDRWHITPAVMRVVWKRDDARCTFVGANGKRCNETHDLQFDHIIPPDRGGDGSAGNVRLRCPAHNLHAAEKLYGRQFIQSKREEAKAKREAAKAQREAERARAQEQREAERAAREAERERQRATVEATRTARDAERERSRAAAEAEREQQRVAAEAARAAAAEAQARELAAVERAKAAAAAAKARIEELVQPLRSLGCSVERARQAAAKAESIPEASFEARLRVAIKSLAPPGTRRVAPDGTRVA